jgi:two-component system, chemotaxis family, protein-glutamate methylesterase/glutaminase
MTPGTSSTTILVCDDSPTYALALARFLAHQPDLEVIGVCNSGEEALTWLRQHAPDLLMMDLELPGMGGLAAIKQIMGSAPLPIVVLSGHVSDGSTQAAAALAAGALATLSKDHVSLGDPESDAALALALRLRRLSHAHVGLRPKRGPTAIARRPPATGVATVIGIGASTGGPAALAAIFDELPGDYPLPVLVVQHMAAGFTSGLVEWLDQRVALPVGLARDRMDLAPGIWFAPDDAHLLLEPGMILALDDKTVVSAHRPAVDVLLSSMATAAGASAIGVVLTGMGGDGGKGTAALRRVGACVIAQDEATSVIFGMPQAAIQAGASCVLPLPELADALSHLALTKLPV